jgi:hypothetical protein
VGDLDVRGNGEGKTRKQIQRKTNGQKGEVEIFFWSPLLASTQACLSFEVYLV